MEDFTMASGSAKPAGSKTVPDYAGIGYSDMGGTDANGKPQPGFADRSNRPDKADPKALYQMPLTKEEQDIMDGKKGPELAKVMKIVVAHGNAFNAEKLVDLADNLFVAHRSVVLLPCLWPGYLC